jgi:hypothetical protein
VTDNETCKSVRNLIPRYHNDQCTETERTFIEDHCAHCQDCRDLLLRTAEAGQDERLQNRSDLQVSELSEKPLSDRTGAHGLEGKEEDHSEKRAGKKWIVPLLLAAAVLLL